LHLRVEPDQLEPYGCGREWEFRHDGSGWMLVDSVDGSDVGAYDQRGKW
jgi:hypothetical protein